MTSKQSTAINHMVKTYSKPVTHPHQIDTVVLCVNFFRRLSSQQRVHITNTINKLLEEEAMDTLQPDKENLFVNGSEFVRLQFKEVGHKTYAYLGFAGKFWNIGRELEGIECLEVFHTVYHKLASNNELAGAYDQYEVSVSQFDICQDHVGEKVSELARNYFRVNGKKKNQAVMGTNLNPARVVDLPASRGKLEEPQTIYVNNKTENGRLGKPKKYLISTKFYNKYQKFQEFYPVEHPYWEWYRKKARADRLLTRIEVSIKTTRECSFITRLFEESFSKGEIMEEADLIASILNHIYNGHKTCPGRRDLRPKINSGRTLEPVLKKFFQPEGPVKTLQSKQRKGFMFKAVDARELLKRKLQDLVQANVHIFSVKEIKHITNEVLS